MEVARDDGAHPSRRSAAANFVENDGTIERALEDALSVDPRVSASRLAVSAAAGVVTLIGVVSTPEARRAAEDDAWNTKGARGVVNRLEVGRSR